MQITAAQGALTNVGIGLRQGFLDYTSDLYRHDFTPLRAPRRWLRRLLWPLTLLHPHHNGRNGAAADADKDRYLPQRVSSMETSDYSATEFERQDGHAGPRKRFKLTYALAGLMVASSAILAAARYRDTDSGQQVLDAAK